MKKILLFIIAFSLVFPQISFAEDLDNHAGSSAAFISNPDSPQTQTDNRVKKLSSFLEKHNSPLAPYAKYFVDAADKYGLDWRLLPAIAGVESSYGKRMPAGSFNPFGWGIYQERVIRFSSFEEAIDTVAKGISQKYPNEAKTNIIKLGRIYNGVTPSSWSSKVTFIMSKIELQPPASSVADIELSI